jgi:PAS domain S-box-containing protein
VRLKTFTKHIILFLFALNCLVAQALPSESMNEHRIAFFKSTPADVKFESGLKLLKFYNKRMQLDSVELTINTFNNIFPELFRTHKFNFKVAKALDGQQLSRPYLLQAYRQAVRKGDSLYIALSKLYIGSLDSLDYLHGERSRLLFEALTYLEKVEYASELDRAYYEVGSLFLDLRDLEKAEEYYSFALPLAEADEDEEIRALVYNDLGNVYYHRKQFDSSLEYFMQALNYYYRTKGYKNIALIENNLSVVLEELGDEDKALRHAQNSLASRLAIADTFGISSSCLNIAYFYNMREEYDSSLIFIEKAISYAKLKERKDVLSVAYQAASKLFEKTNDYKDALYYYKLHKMLKDSLYKKEKYEIVQKYEAEKDIAVNKLRNKFQIESFENKIQRNSILIGALILLLILASITLFIVYRSSRIKKKFSQEIFKNLKFLEMLIETVPDPIFYRDDKGLFVGCNRAFTELVGKEKGRIIGRSQAQVYDKPYLKDFIQDDAKLLKDIEEVQYNKTYVNKDGEQVYLQFRNAPYKIPMLGTRGVIGLIIDMTKQKNIEKQLIKANETKELFISIISHDIRNSFNAVLAFTSLLHDDYNFYNDDKRIELIGNIHEASNNTFLLLENLLGWSRSQQGGITINKQLTDVKDIIEESITLLKPTSNEKNILVKNNVEQHELLIDENSIKTVFRNLISNAIKYSNYGDEICISSEQVNDNFLIHFQDNGVGIEEDNIPLLFKLNKKNQRLGTNNESGSGLGLLLSRELLLLNEGEICVSSKFGKGSKFTVQLPVEN